MVNRSVHPSVCPSDRALKAHRTPVHFCLCLSATLCLKSLCYSVKTFLFPHSHDHSSSGNLGARLLRFGSYCTISRTVLSFPSLRPSPPSPRVGLELAVVRITSNVRCSTTFNISSKVTAADYIAETTARIGSAGDTALPCISPYPCLQHFSFTFHFTFFRSSSADADKFFAPRFFFYPRVSSQLCTFRDVRRDVLLDFDIQFLSRFFPTSYYTSLLSLFRSLSFFGSILNSFVVPSKSFSPIFHQRPRISNFFLSRNISRILLCPFTPTTPHINVL